MAETTAVAEKKEETAVQHINKVTDFSLGILEHPIISQWLIRWQRHYRSQH